MAMIIAPGPIGQTIFMASKVWVAVLPVAWWLWVQKGRLSLSKPTRGGFGVAIASGLIITAGIFGAYWLLGRHWIDAGRVQAMAQQNGIGSTQIYLAMAVYWITVNSLLEEYVWRWFVVRQCEALMNPLAAVVCSAAFFTAHHVIALKVQFDWPVTVLASLGVFIGGAVWSWLYVRYRSVWVCYASHAIVDVPIFVIGWWLIFG